jgi:hypothetical protein
VPVSFKIGHRNDLVHDVGGSSAPVLVPTFGLDLEAFTVEVVDATVEPSYEDDVFAGCSLEVL